MPGTPRLRSYAPDSHIFMEHAVVDSEGDHDLEDRGAVQRRLRTAILSKLKYDEQLLDLACHRMMNISNRTSAEQFGINPSVANRKGRRAIKMLIAAGVAELLERSLTKGDAVGLTLTLPLRDIRNANDGCLVSVSDQTRTFRRRPTLDQLHQFVKMLDRRFRMLERAIDAESNVTSEETATAIFSFKTGNGWTLVAGEFFADRDTMLAENHFPNGSQIWTIRDRRNVGLSEIVGCSECG